MTLAWPWMLLALPLPWLVRRWMAPVPTHAALRVPSLDHFGVASSAASGTISTSLDWRVALCIWLLLVAAATRPQTSDDAHLPISGRDLVLALDVSVSMGTTDLRLDGRPVDRLTAARALARDFLAKREGDRVGLIVFGTQAFLHTPLTFDLGAVQAALSDVGIGLAGRETAIGDAIGLAVARMREHGDSAKVLILLTDGANTAGALTPQQAGWIAQREGLRIHTVGVGAERMQVVADGGIREINPSIDLDADTLREIAHKTGGIYQRATDTDSLAGFYRLIDELEPTASAIDALRPVRELFHWPLALAWVLGAWLISKRRIGAIRWSS